MLPYLHRSILVLFGPIKIKIRYRTLIEQVRICTWRKRGNKILILRWGGNDKRHFCVLDMPEEQYVMYYYVLYRRSFLWHPIAGFRPYRFNERKFENPIFFSISRHFSISLKHFNACSLNGFFIEKSHFSEERAKTDLRS